MHLNVNIFILVPFYITNRCDAAHIRAEHNEGPMEGSNCDKLNWLHIGGDDQGLAKFVVLPGTKWCGDGDVAKDYDDLGYLVELDKCCREHDNCPDLIFSGKTKHGLTNRVCAVDWNTGPMLFINRLPKKEGYQFNVLHCNCDDKFLKCLVDVNSLLSLKIGYVFFNVLGPKCFRKDYPATCKKKLCFFCKKCVEYDYDLNGVRHYQWFDVPWFY